jgi:type I restriction enzyme S subunit
VVQRYKQVFVERDERSESGAETLLSVSAYTGVSPRSEIIDDGDHLSRAESLEGYKVCHPNDLVMNIMLAWNRGLGFSSQHGIVSPAYSVFIPTPGNNPRFLDYMVRSDRVTLYFKAFSSGVIESRLRLYPDTFGSLFCVLPPLFEQTAIVAFLDRETGKIDELIAEQEKLITLLAEKRLATISHAVTCGLNAGAPMKDSGVAWMGEVPAHWNVIQLKHLCELLKDGTHLPPARVAQGIPLLSVRNISESTFSLREDDSMISLDDFRALCRAFVPQAGDVLLAIVGATLGKVALVPDGLGDFHIQRSLAIFRTKQLMSPKWLFYCISSGAFQRQLWENAGFSAQPGIYLGTLQNFKLPLPPLIEQVDLCEFLDGEVAKLDSLNSEASRAISLLKERRSALIAAAVTGQVDVRGVQQPAEKEEAMAA